MPRNAIYSAENCLPIPVRFAELRRLTNEVPAYMAELVGVEIKPWPLRTAVEDDWGVAGLDTEELLVAFGEKYRVDLSRFDFTGFISPEGMTLGQGCFATVVAGPLLALWLIKAALAGLCWLFIRSWAAVIWQLSVRQILWPTKPRPTLEVLTTGDFVASAAAGHFVKRERVRFVLVKGSAAQA